MAYTNVKVPEGGEKISIKDGKLDVPDHPIIPFVEAWVDHPCIFLHR